MDRLNIPNSSSLTQHELALTIKTWRGDYDNTSLHEGARSGDEELVRIALRYGCEVDARNSCNETALNCADYHVPEVIRCLLEAGSDVNFTDCLQQSPLHLAVQAENYETVSLVLAAGVDVSLKDEDDKTALEIAVENELVEIARLIIENGADVNDPSYTKSLLRLAAKKRNDMSAAMFELLLDMGADATCIYEDGTTPLHYAVLLSDPDCARRLLQQGVDVNHQDADGYSALHEAVQERNLSMVELLLDHGADVSAKTSEGDTPLHWAIYGNNEETFDIVKLLLDFGADCNSANDEETTPLLDALKFGTPKLLRMLLAHGADLNARNFHGETAIHRAALNDNICILNFVVDVGHDIDGVNTGGFSALHYAAAYGNLKGCQTLVRRGASINCISNDSRAPLHQAVIHEHCEIIQYLLEEGASIDIKTEKSKKSVLRIAEENECENVQDVLVSHMARLRYCNAMVDELDVKIIEKNPHLIKLYDQCKNELEKMKKKRIYNNITLLDLFTKSKKVITNWARNEELMQALNSIDASEFPIYFTAIKSRMVAAYKRQAVLLNLTEYLGNDPHFESLGYDHIPGIIEFLGENYIYNFERAISKAQTNYDDSLPDTNEISFPNLKHLLKLGLIT